MEAISRGFRVHSTSSIVDQHYFSNLGGYDSRIVAEQVPRCTHWIIRGRAGLKRRMSEPGATRTAVA